MALSLILAGILAGLIQYFVDFRGLIIYQEDSSTAQRVSLIPNEYLRKIFEFISRNWQFFGYITIGVGGAFLVPVVDALSGSGLTGLDKIKEHLDCRSLPKDPTNPCHEISYWNYLVLFGYGMIFGYSGVRALRSIGTWLLDKIVKKQDETQEKVNQTQAQVKVLEAKYNTLLNNVSDKISTLKLNSDRGIEVFNAYFNETENSAARKSYYQGVNWQTEPNLFSNLNLLLATTHSSYHIYKPSKFLYPIIDRYEDGLLRSIYSDTEYSLEEILRMDSRVDLERAEAIGRLLHLNLSKNEYDSKLLEIQRENPYNCEHVVPRSWFDQKCPMDGDLHHLFACEKICNDMRADYPYTDFPENSMDPCGKLGLGKFEPVRNKGVVARAVLYFLLRYPGKVDLEWKYTQYDIEMLLRWHLESEISLYELHRNQEIYKSQGNRNPFIDFPVESAKIIFPIPT